MSGKLVPTSFIKMYLIDFKNAQKVKKNFQKIIKFFKNFRFSSHVVINIKK